MNERQKNCTNESESMCDTVVAALDDAKGIEIKILDIRNPTDFADFMVVATGTSDRHVKTISDRVLEFMQEKNWQPYGLEGEDTRDWVLVDFIDVVVHIMRDKTRKHYDLESLWDETFIELNQNGDGGNGEQASVGNAADGAG